MQPTRKLPFDTRYFGLTLAVQTPDAQMHRSACNQAHYCPDEGDDIAQIIHPHTRLPDEARNGTVQFEAFTRSSLLCDSLFRFVA
jgi:hypothetical protein